MGEAGERGTIEVGKIADLVLLDRNPLDDPEALRLVASVFQRGHRVA
jgi:imidazolonepropionase-like amidohydrolase